MRNMMLIAAVLLVLLAGFFAVTVLGRVLARQKERNAVEPLRVGLSSHIKADSMTETVQAFSKSHPDVPVQMIYGTNSELIHALKNDQMDVVVVSKTAHFPSAEDFHIRQVSLHPSSEAAKLGGFPIDPIAKSDVTQYVLWRRHAAQQTANGFVECMDAKKLSDGVSSESVI